VNILPLAEQERINAILPIGEYDKSKFIVMATSQGTIKKVSLDQFSRPRSNGIIALDLAEGDKLIGVDITDGEADVMLFTDAGKAIRFHESSVRGMGRTARGVRGVKLKDGQQVMSLIIVRASGAVLIATKNGYGKRTSIDEFSPIGRGGQGVIAIQVSERNGKVVRATQVDPQDEAMLITDQGTLVRLRIEEISLIGRNTQGVRLINLKGGEKLVGMQRIEELPEEGT
ncbi:MAG: DNA gyrase C-terminal beta-propeller domain-containing protein, partial [Gammaproteobacteria bacterium]